MGSTIENIKRNPNISLAVWNEDWKENCVGYSIEGKAEYFEEGKWYEKIKEIPENKDEPCKGAVLVTVKKIKKIG
jgi:predicted pyridoxine 5'-phosphate oxidase superfamily flavin-nucleotide-binding protein